MFFYLVWFYPHPPSLFLYLFAAGYGLYLVSSNVEINFPLGQNQTVLLMCCWPGQFNLNRGFKNTILKNQDFVVTEIHNSQLPFQGGKALGKMLGSIRKPVLLHIFWIAKNLDRVVVKVELVQAVR